MGKKLHDEFSEIIFKKLNGWKRVNGEGFHVNLIDAFWLMHLDFKHFINHLRPTPTDKKRNASAFHEDIVAIKGVIVSHHSKLFETDFQNYTANFLDEIYSDIFFDRNNVFENLPSSDSGLFSNIIALVDEVKNLLKVIEDFQSKHGQELQINKPISSLSDVKKLSVSLTDDKLNGKLKQDLKIISEKIIRLQGQVKALTLNCNESEINAAMKFCDEKVDNAGALPNY